jgi:hypothetical protein
MLRRAVLLAVMLVLVLGVVGCEEAITEETITEDTATQETPQETAPRETITLGTITQEDVYAYKASVGEYSDAYKYEVGRALEEENYDTEHYALVEDALIDGDYITEEFADNFVSSNKEVGENLWKGNAVRETGLQAALTFDWTLDNVTGDSYLEGNTFVMVLSEGNNRVISRYEWKFVWVDGKWMLDDMVVIPAS